MVGGGHREADSRGGLRHCIRGSSAPGARSHRGVSLPKPDSSERGVASGPVEGDPGVLSFTGGLKVFVALEPCDMRKGFNGLHALVTERLGEDPRTGALFVFTNRRHSRLKILCWDGTGLWVCTKRLEKGTFSWPRNTDVNATKLRLTPDRKSTRLNSSHGKLSRMPSSA